MFLLLPKTGISRKQYTNHTKTKAAPYLLACIPYNMLLFPDLSKHYIFVITVWNVISIEFCWVSCHNVMSPIQYFIFLWLHFHAALNSISGCYKPPALSHYQPLMALFLCCMTLHEVCHPNDPLALLGTDIAPLESCDTQTVQCGTFEHSYVCLFS